MLAYLHLMAYGTVGLDVSLLGKKSKTASPFNTMHMWFIYYLIWFCVLTAALAPLASTVPARLRSAADGVFGALVGSWWGPFVLAVPLAVIGSFYRAGVLAASGSFIPNLPELVHNGLFFVAGLYLYRHQDSLFALYTARCWRYMAAGSVSFVLALGAFKSGAVHSVVAPVANEARWMVCALPRPRRCTASRPYPALPGNCG
jgi:glucan biosynthesis protein C